MGDLETVDQLKEQIEVEKLKAKLRGLEINNEQLNKRHQKIKKVSNISVQEKIDRFWANYDALDRNNTRLITEIKNANADIADLRNNIIKNSAQTESFILKITEIFKENEIDNDIWATLIDEFTTEVRNYPVQSGCHKSTYRTPCTRWLRNAECKFLDNPDHMKEYHHAPLCMHLVNCKNKKCKRAHPRKRRTMLGIKYEK